MTTPDVSVVVVSWNGRHYLDACLAALAAQQEVSFETIVVDNASTDGTSEYLARAFPWVRVVRLEQNRGFAGGNNAGARSATGRYVAFLNNDTVADPRWLATLLEGMDARTGTLLTTSRIVYMHDPAVIDSAGDGMLRCGGAFKHHHGAPAAVALQSREVFGVCGAACLVSRDVFEELGGFDADFFHSHEDVDLSYRARLRGYRCRYVAESIVRHHGGGTGGKVSAFATFHGQRNLEWLYIKNTPAALLVRTLPGHLVYVAAAALHFARLGLLPAFLKGKLAAVAGLRDVAAKRTAIQRNRRVAPAAIWVQLERRWLATKLREKRFDVGFAGETR